jgi:hypothetical protein
MDYIDGGAGSDTIYTDSLDQLVADPDDTII